MLLSALLAHAVSAVNSEYTGDGEVVGCRWCSMQRSMLLMVPGVVESFSYWVQLTWAVRGCLPGENGLQWLPPF